MSLRKHISIVCPLAALLLTLSASAEEPTLEASATTTNRPGIHATLRGGEKFGIHQIQRAFINIGTNQIVFIVPSGFQMDATNPQKIVLTDNAKGYFISVRVNPASEASVETGACRAEALKRFPGAKITEESTDLVANHSGASFNLEWVNPSGASESAHINFIHSAAGILEFSFTARTANFKDAKNYFESLLSSVQNNENGKVVIVPLPDFS